MSTTIESTLKQRGAEYGSFYDQAALSQALKACMARGAGWQRLAPDQREALEMVAVKASRVLTGNPDHFDSWHDIAGYAQLVANRLAE